MSRDFHLDQATHDLVMVGGNPVMAEGVDELRQRVKVRALTHRGEWQFDLAVGMPYREQIMVKNPDLAIVKATIAAELITIPDTTGIIANEVDIDSGRNLSNRIDMDTVYGPTGEIEV